MLSERVARFIRDRKLLKKDGRYIVALSGGADSVALLLVLKEQGYSLSAAHCNFRLRGDESERDEAFCVQLCEWCGVDLHRAHFDTREYAALHKVSIEMAARELRYSYFRQLRRDIGADAICVAHHRDDTVETVLMNLIRGTGLHGLTGIQPVNGDIVRPLLCVSRGDIERFLSDRQQAYVTDSSNLVDDVTRNKLRLDVLPMLQAINPSVGDSIARTAMRLTEAAKVMDDALRRSADRCHVSDDRQGRGVINISRLLAQPSPEYTLFYILRQYGFSSAQIEDIYKGVDAPTGTAHYSATSQLLFDRGNIIIEPRRMMERTRMVLPENGTYVIDNSRKIKIETVPGHDISKQRTCCTLDGEKATFPMVLRTNEQGDRFVPYGAKGSRLLSDYLTDRKKTLFEKRRQLVLADGDGNIMWVVGERVDGRYGVTDKTTRVVRVTLITG